MICQGIKLKQSIRGDVISTRKYLDNTDYLVILLEQCKRQQLTCNDDPYIREVVRARKLGCVLAYGWQLDEIVNVCTDPRENAIFGVDPTFNLGPFNVTVTTCSNLKVTDRASNVHQTIVGPLMLSQKKAFDS